MVRHNVYYTRIDFITGTILSGNRSRRFLTCFIDYHRNHYDIQRRKKQSENNKNKRLIYKSL